LPGWGSYGCNAGDCRDGNPTLLPLVPSLRCPCKIES
jgi:hypothetical protein